MRKFFSKVLTLILIAEFALSCANLYEEHNLSVGNLSGDGVLIVECEGAQSRTYMDDDTKLYWHSDDRLAVFCGNNDSVEYRFNGTTGDKSGSISPVSQDEAMSSSFDAVYAYYPYEEGVALNDDQTLQVSLPMVQNYEAGGFARGVYPMVSVSESLANNLLTFRNVCGMLKLQLWGNVAIRSITIKGNNGEILSGDAAVIASYDAMPTIEMMSSGSNYVAVDCGDGLQLNAKVTDIYVVLPPVTLSRGFTMEIEDVEGNVYMKSTAKSIIIKRNTILPMQAVEIAYTALPASNELWYTTTNGAQLSLSSDKFNAAIVSHNEVDGKWVVKFATDLTTLNKESFDSKSTLKSITLPDSVTRIEDFAFYNCSSLADVHLSANLEYLGQHVFSYCEAIKSINIPASLSSFASSPFNNAVIDTLTIDCNLADIELDNGAIASEPLLYNAEVKNLVFTPMVEYVGAYSFMGQSSLKSITMPYGIKSVGDGAFWGCSSLTEVTFPESVTSIGSMVLDGCSSLTAVTCMATTPPSLGVSAFPYNISVRVPDSVLSAYQLDAQWSKYRLNGIESANYTSTDYSANGEVVVLQRATEGSGIDILLMGDGYSDRQIASGLLEAHCRKGVDAMFSEEPFKSYQHLFNIYMMKTISKYEGVDGTQTSGRTVFGSYFGDGTEIIANDNIVNTYAQKMFSEEQLYNTLIVVIINSDHYGGTCYMNVPYVRDPELYFNGYFGDGPAIAYFTLCGDDERFRGLILHEACGHGFAKLGDEYFYSGNGEIPGYEYWQYFDALEPLNWFKNVHLQKGDAPTAESVKWKHFLEDEHYQYDGLGIFKGGLTYPEGVYRPTDYSIMRSNYGGFNAPSREAIYRRIHYLAYGLSWEYDYDKFVEYDFINRKTEASVSALAMPQSMVYGDSQILHTPPRIILK